MAVGVGEKKGMGEGGSVGLEVSVGTIGVGIGGLQLIVPRTKSKKRIVLENDWEIDTRVEDRYPLESDALEMSMR